MKPDRSPRAVMACLIESLESRRLLAAWAMAQRDAQHTGRADYAVPAGRLNAQFFDYFLWQTRVPGSPNDGRISSTQMTFFDGAGPNGRDVVLGSFHWPKGVAGLDRHTGQLLWSGNPGGGELIGEITPAFSNDGSSVYVVNDSTQSTAHPDGHPLMAFPTATGPGTFRHNGGDAQPSLTSSRSPTIAPDGRVFLHSWVDRPRAATDTGTQLTTTWSAATEIASGYSDPALYGSGSNLRVIAAGREGDLASYHGTTGAQLWRLSMGATTDASPTIDPANGRIYVPVGENDVSVVGVSASGQPLWGASARKLVFDSTSAAQDQRAQTTGALSADGGTYYFQTVGHLGAGRLYAINTVNGTLRWSLDTQSKGWEGDYSRPIVTANGVIIVGNNENGTYYAIKDNGTSATVLDTLVVDAGGTARASATLAPDGKLYLPLRTKETIGSASSAVPSLETQNLFTAIDVGADPKLIVPLIDPRGVAAGLGGETLVAEGAAARIGVFDVGGNRVRSIGTPGGAVGQLSNPSDVDVDALGRIFVLDTGNRRVSRFSATGIHQVSFGSTGGGPGQFSAPRGLHVDRARAKLYVADAGSHRVQRFNLDGTLDTTWGGDGIVGATGIVRRDHGGFDRPSDVAVNPTNGHVYVTDYGNHRIEVFDQSGNYVRTYLAIYRPNALAFTANGDAYIAGEDPHDGGEAAYDGRVRLLRAGDELLSRHYTGGLDDIGKTQHGIAVRGDGRIVFSDTLNGRLVTADAALNTPASDLRVEANGTSVTVRWETREAGPSIVRWGVGGQLQAEQIVAGSRTDHVVTISNLTPGTVIDYAVSIPDSFDNGIRFTRPDRINVGTVTGHQFLRLKAVMGLYTDGNPNAGYARWSGLQRQRDIAQLLTEFYWRNSGFKVWIDLTIVEIDADVTGPIDAWGRLESDLAAAGYGAAHDFDFAMSVSNHLTGWFGGGGGLFGRSVGMFQWSDYTFAAVHEANHAIDSIFDHLGLRRYEGNHGIWAVPNGVGRDFSINGQILRNLQPANLVAGGGPYSKVMTAPDADRDGVPDASPAGLTNPLPITEATLGASAASADTDGDGLSDLAEASLLVYAGSNPVAADTDGDGTADGIDLNPAYRMNDRIASGTPTVDGTINPNDGWTTMTQNWGFANRNLLDDGQVDDNNLYQSRLSTYAAWDDHYLYLAYRGPALTSDVRIDGSADNWFFGPDNYDLSLSSGNAFKRVRVNVGVPDVYRQIDNDGQYSEFFDDDPQFSRPYQGRTIYDNPNDGLGFLGRLVTEAALPYARGGSGDNSIWEVAIPWSKVTGLQGGHLKEMALWFRAGGDRLFESDHFARVRLVDTRAPRLVSVNYVAGGAMPQWSVDVSEDVSASLNAGDVALRNLDTNQTIDSSLLSFIPGSDGDFVIRYTGSANGALPDGRYRLTINAAGVTDVAGNALASGHTLDFVVLAGDADGDRVVDFDDLLILAQNYGQRGRTFAQGNFDYSVDGRVDFNDLLILAQRYGTALTMATPAASAAPAARARRPMAEGIV